MRKQSVIAIMLASQYCEGVIGSSVSAKLAKDFADFQKDADAHEDRNFREKYAEWRKEFEMAADDGAVSFHGHGLSSTGPNWRICTGKNSTALWGRSCTPA